MKKLLTFLFLATATVAMTGCDDDDGGDVQPTPPNNNITENTTWKKGEEHILRGNVYVVSGVTLNIEPGTVIKGDKATKGALIISRGAKLMAEGTAAEPIIFTSNQPIGQRDRGDWGGVVILGKANANNLDGTMSATIEGISSSTGDNGLYGGNNDSDDSGKLTYARIEFAGIALSPDNELNSLTMGSVGSETDIHHIMVSYAGDDAYEWFGGTVDHEYLVALRTIDDDFDTDKGYTGNLQYGLVMRDPNTADISGARAFEASSSSTDGTAPVSSPTFANFTLLGPKMFTTGSINSNYKHGVRADKDSEIKVYNSIIAGFPTGMEAQAAGADNPAANPTYGGNVLVHNNTDFVNYSAGTNVVADSIPMLYSQKQFNLTSSNAPVLKSGSIYLAGADAINGFESTGYYGAFGTTPNSEWNWNSGWLEFDPQNKAY